MTRTAVIVQARMASTRLPGKVLLPLGGTTVLDHVLTRCASISGADVVCCAVPDTADSDPVAEEAERIGKRTGARVIRGSESDVLDRYYQAARAVGAERILRVTSDCPLIDPRVCDCVLSLLAERNADYAANNMPPSWPHGLDCEAFNFDWLERAAKEAHEPFEREHVTPYIRTHRDVRKVNLEGPGGELATYRWTLDTPADLTFMRAIFERLPPGDGAWRYEVPLAIVEAEPQLSTLNAGDNVRLSRDGHAQNPASVGLCRTPGRAG